MKRLQKTINLEKGDSMKYYQKTFDGKEVLMDTNGKIYEEKQYRLEFREADSKYVYVRHYKTAVFNEVIEYMKSVLREFAECPEECIRLKSIQIIENDTDKLVKEYKRVGSIKY